jgi:hypothetical protein
MHATTRLHQFILNNSESIFITGFGFQIKIKDLSHSEKKEIRLSPPQLKLYFLKIRENSEKNYSPKMPDSQQFWIRSTSLALSQSQVGEDSRSL